MSNRAKRRQHRPSAQNRNQQAAAKAKIPAFTPVPVRTRMDGWTPDRQVAFVTALAATACIEDACGAVGMSPRSYYDLRARPGSDSFRQAVEAALDVGTHRLETALLSRAIHGEATPIFYKGEQVGERRRYDNKLGLALLRARAPDRYGAWRDRVQTVREHPDGAAMLFTEAKRRLAEDGKADLAGRARPKRAPLRPMILDSGADADPDEAESVYESQVALLGRLAEYHRRNPLAGDEQDDTGNEEEDDDDAYAEELAAQIADPIKGPRVSTLYTSAPDGG